MSYLEELLPEFRKGAKIRKQYWRPDHYLYYENNGVWNEDTELVSFDGVDLVSTNWEFYKEPEPDWDYIIDNKCLCCFWDRECKIVFIDKLIECNCGIFSRFRASSGSCWDNCRPIRRDEVTFYEDTKNE